MAIKVGWIDKILEIGAKKDNYILIREARLLRNQIEELQQEMGEIKHCLGELDTEMVYRDLTTHS